MLISLSGLLRAWQQACLGALLLLLVAHGARAQTVLSPTPLCIGETFTIESKVLHETRRINVYAPPGYGGNASQPLPVLYMPDGGIKEDFLHVAGLVEVLVGDEAMRPFLLVGIENTERRRDLTGPTTNEEDRKIAPRVGGSAAFRAFLRTELMPAIRERYRTTPETAIVGESLAGLFVVETLLLEPDLFTTYLAFDPSLWWNNNYLTKQADHLLRAYAGPAKTLYLAASSQPDIAEATRHLAASLRTVAPPAITWHYAPLPAETHQTIYHPAALQALRTVFKLPQVPASK
ncbi:alpha/beta hydrolase [Hymenobacter sp. UV11]|uniref:alpha/beta hydrolase n=1 Tax=Hymenobacter sp. UV11 TaxID=1849735 RepID=UPI00105CF509|nr:alpha/beta hydrolase-fold protein [Hymenobacter sp. UV11]TDN38532.1 esterase [Hymenobacter sp. UV11]TFZ65268.1 alpha/beta hydrolase [Hymenobacter sp. UV11]